MTTYRRVSPVAFTGKPAETEKRNGWEVVLQYRDEGPGPHVIDLSHRTKWDVQDRQLSRLTPLGAAIPDTPGRCAVEGGALLSRMNRTQASVWHLWADAASLPEAPSFTDVTDGVALLALAGRNVFSILEKTTELDLAAPGGNAPFLVQGPLLHVPCQIVILSGRPEGQLVLIGFSRGYGQSMAEALLEAGSQWGLQPAGEKAFTAFATVEAAG